MWLRKSLLLSLLFLLVFLVPSYSEKSYTITETELAEIQAKIEQAQKALIEAQKSLETAQTSLTASQAEIDKLKMNLETLAQELLTLNQLYQTLWIESKKLKTANNFLIGGCIALFLIGVLGWIF